MAVSVRMCSSTSEEQRSLEIYNEVWPRRAATDADVQAWKQASVATADFLGAVDGADAGSAAASIDTSGPYFCRTIVTVLPHLRRRGVGSALFGALSAWTVKHGAQELETAVESDDEDSLGFALRRGFHLYSREIGLELNLAQRTRRSSIRWRASRSCCSRIIPSWPQAHMPWASKRCRTSPATRTGRLRRSSSSWRRIFEAPQSSLRSPTERS